MATMVETKAKAIFAVMTANGQPQAEAIPPNILAILMQLLTTLLSSFGLCPTPTPAQVQAILANPSRMHQRVLRRTAQRLIKDPAKAALAEEATLVVGQTTTLAEAAQLYTEANGHAPAGSGP